ncbi:MAG TPA: hypothetical protein VER55_08070, partial [Ardenticatenaceae bacterium]|nr:hypothetical protein [Ardenticatenaceae bacterium]
MRGLGALVGAAGWWLPWVLHPSGAAALVLLGLDLGEFFKFTDAGRAGRLEWERQLFYLPPVLASLALAALAAERRFLGRLLLTSTASLLAVVVLPPYPYDRSRLLSAEFRFQTLSALFAFACAAIALLAPLFGRPPRALLRTLQAAIGIAGAGLPLW